MRPLAWGRLGVAGGWAAVALLLDQASKAWVRSALTPHRSVPIIEGVFHLTYVQNPGAAFGLRLGRGTLFLVLPVVLLAAMVWLLPRLPHLPGPRFLVPAGFGLVAAGAMGNLIDRIRWGIVTDFLDFRVWPVFNLADVFIVVGAGLLGLALWVWEGRSQKTSEGRSGGT